VASDQDEFLGPPDPFGGVTDLDDAIDMMRAEMLPSGSWKCRLCDTVHALDVVTCKCFPAVIGAVIPGTRIEVHPPGCECADSARCIREREALSAKPKDPLTQVLDALPTPPKDTPPGPLEARAIVTGKGRSYSVAVEVRDGDHVTAKRVFDVELRGVVSPARLPRFLQQQAENAMELLRQELAIPSPEWSTVAITMPSGDVVRPQPIG
jgi:hypothetical protein